MRDKDGQWSNLCKEAHLQATLATAIQIAGTTYLADVPHYTVYDLTFERLEHDGPVSSYKLCLAASTQYHAFSDVQDADYSDDVPELA